MKNKWTVVEPCPHCGEENFWDDLDPVECNYTATCQYCGKKMFLCDECQHSDDNPIMKCDWTNCPGDECGTCFRCKAKKQDGKMKVQDLVGMGIDVDVYDNVCDDIGIAFCGPMVITDLGKEKFKTALNLECELITRNGYTECTVNVESGLHPDAWKANLKEAKQFFYAIAGYCSADDYDLWFEII